MDENTKSLIIKEAKSMMSGAYFTGNPIIIYGNTLYIIGYDSGSMIYMIRRIMKEDIFVDPCTFMIDTNLDFWNWGDLDYHQAFPQFKNPSSGPAMWNYYEYTKGEELACLIGAKNADQEFANLVTEHKADDGCEFYKLLGKNGKIYMIPILSGFPPVGKPDDLDLYIYAHNSNPKLVYLREVIHKKKAGTFEIVMNILNL